MKNLYFITSTIFQLKLCLNTKNRATILLTKKLLETTLMLSLQSKENRYTLWSTL